MANNIGYEFQPGAQKRLVRGINQQQQLGPGAQEALKVLSLRLPAVLGGSPLAPEDLLRSRPGGGMETALNRLSGGAPTVPPAPPVSTGGGGSPFGVATFNNEPSDLAELVGGAVSPGPPRVTPGTGGNRAPLPGAPPSQSQPGPGVPTFPPSGGGPTVDRRNPEPGNRGGSAPTSTTQSGDMLVNFLRRVLDRRV